MMTADEESHVRALETQLCHAQEHVRDLELELRDVGREVLLLREALELAEQRIAALQGCAVEEAHL